MYELSDRPWFKYWPKDVPRHIDYPEIPLYALLTETARKCPESIAFKYETDSMTYTELDRATDKLAAGLADEGIKKGDTVVLFLPNSFEFVIGYYGILKAGASVVPVNPLYKEEELKYQINDSEASAIIAGADSLSIIQAIRKETGLKTIIVSGPANKEEAVSLQTILDKYDASRYSPVKVNPTEDIAAIEYTGGTTGPPKGAMLTHYNLVANAIQNAVWLGWSKNDIIIGLLPFYHSWGACTCVNSAIYSCSRVIVMTRFDAGELLNTIQRERATILYGAASMFTILVANPLLSQYDLSSLRCVKAGAMLIPAETRAKWEQLTGVTMVLGYGLSEASPETHDSPLDRIVPETIGIPVMDTDARIVDEKTGETDMPPGKAGELIIRGPQVMKGYLKRPDENKTALRDGWLYTGDLATMDRDGFFRIVDRKKEIIKYKGYTIAPGEVESVLYQHYAIKECAVIGRPDPALGEIPKAYVVLLEGCETTADEIIDFCKQRISPYKRIREVEFIDEIPKSRVGKILRRLLRDRQ
jgi:long-chain acyl-CoA synthetase